MADMIDTSTKAVKALMDGVTEGPWVFGHDPEDASNPKISIHLPGGEYYIAQVDEGHEQEANARFITAARDLVPALLDERDDLRDKLDAAVALLIDASADLTAYVDADYPPESCARYPDSARRHHRDLELVRRIATTTTIAKIKGADHE